MGFFFSHPEVRKGVLFLAVGAFSTLLNYTTFWVLLQMLVVYYLFASWIGYFAGVAAGFFLNAVYTFQAGPGLGFRHAVFYGLVYAVSLGLSSITLFILVEKAHLLPKAANLIVILQSTLTNYLGCRLGVFRKS